MPFLKYRKNDSIQNGSKVLKFLYWYGYYGVSAMMLPQVYIQFSNVSE